MPFPQIRAARGIRTRTTPFCLALTTCILALTAHAVPDPPGGVPSGGIPPHLATARQLVRDLRRGALTNPYGSDPTFLRWGTPTREARTVCGSFVTRLLEHAYGWSPGDIRRRLGAGGADASEWHAAIVSGNGFRRLRSIGDVRPGDLLAVRYDAGSADTGHVMVVDRGPERRVASPPEEGGWISTGWRSSTQARAATGRRTRATCLRVA